MKKFKFILSERRMLFFMVCGVIIIISLGLAWWTQPYTMVIEERISGELTVEVTVDRLADVTGWEVQTGEVPWTSSGGVDLTLTGAVLMLAGPVLLFALIRFKPDNDQLQRILRKATVSTPWLAVGGVAYYMVDAQNSDYSPLEGIGTGPWLAVGVAVVCLIVGVRVLIPGKVRRMPWDDEDGVAEPSLIKTRARREYYDKRATASKPKPKASEEEMSMARYHFKQAADFESRGEDNNAIDEYTRAIECAPDYAAAYYNRGSLYSLQGEAEKAVADFEKAIELTDDPDLRRTARSRATKTISAAGLRGRTVSVSGGEGKSGEKFQRSLTDVAGAKAKFYEAGDLQVKGQTEEALAAYTEAIRLDGEFALAYYYRGMLLESKGDVAGALADFQATTEFSNDPKIIDMANTRIGVLKNVSEE